MKNNLSEKRLKYLIKIKHYTPKLSPQPQLRAALGFSK